MPTTRENALSGEENYTKEAERSIRRGWRVGSMSRVILVLTACMLVYIGAVTMFFQTALQNELTSQAAEAAGFISGYARRNGEAMKAAAIDYAASYSDRGSVEIQFITPDGALVYSSQGRSPGIFPQGGDVTSALSGETAAWHGRDKFTGETVMSAAAALVTSDGEVAGVIRCVSSMHAVNGEIVKYCGLAIIITAFILMFVYISNVRFEHSVMDPISQINDTAQMIADGLYGVHIDTVYPDKIGELCKTLNSMSDAISRSEKLKNDFISSVSHELRTPLTAIGGWGETLLAGGAGESEETRRGLTIITNEAGRLARMVEELLDFSRMESGSLAMRMERIDLTPDIEDVVFMYMESIRREGIVLEYDEADSLPEIIGDRNRLRQVFLNLLDNAIKHGGEGKCIRVETYSEAQTLVVNVRDFGAGIPASELSHVKERFFKGSSKARGSGIGLAIADEIMKLHGGRLDIKSVVGQGTVATMILPAIIGDPDAEML